jgi:hypothetical protein
MVFRAKVSGVASETVRSFDWTVSSGTITTGQGTDRIKVFSEENGSNVTATVTIRGSGESCVSTASKTAVAPANIGCPMPADEYSEASWEDERARLDNLLVQIRNNPKAHAFIQMAVPPRVTIENTKKHIIKILKHFRSREPDFHLERLQFAVEKSEEYRFTRFWIIPEDATDPACAEGCTLINGKHLYF